ncbi:MAG: cytochrome c oxidase subunit I [Actinobacteria bacterium]|nr:cytochrome c oxidase subunit I [Actinomycetota bacterium]
MNYMVTSFIMFLIGGAMAILMRVQLSVPNNNFVSLDTYAQLFTIHGTIMLFLFLGPFAFGTANYLVPLQIGAPDMAFPRFNAFSYWLFLGGCVVLLSSFLTSSGAADWGWFAYAPLTETIHSPGPGADMWIVGVALASFSSMFTGINLIATVFCLRAPGMTMFRMPIFVWNQLITAFLVLLAFPVLTSALVLLWCDRHLGTNFFNPTHGGQPILWQNLFWFFGHPEVYILALPFFGMVTEVIAVFSRKPVFGYKGLVFATLAIGALSMGVWAHHMYTTGAVLLPFFAIMTLLISVPTGVKFFNWIGTMFRGSVRLETPMLFAIGFLVNFLLGGFTGIMLAEPPLDFQLHDTYFVIAHFHYVLFGGSVFAMFAGIYYWFPKFTGKKLDDRLGKISFVIMFIGFNLTFFPQHDLGLRGMQRRIAVYPANAGWSFLNMLSSIGSFILAFSIIPFLINVWVTLRNGNKVGPNPWDGMTLEWATSSPPPEHNFEFIPPIRSERPVWDLNHPDHPTLPHGRHAREIERARALAGVRSASGSSGLDYDTGGNGNGGNGNGGNGNGGNGDGGAPPGGNGHPGPGEGEP